MQDRTFLRRACLVLSAAALAVTTAACGGAADQQAGCARTYTIGFSHPVGEAAFVKALKKRVTTAAEAAGCTTVLLDNTQANNLESQRATIDTWITQRVDAIVVLPVDATSLATVQKRAQSSGIKWLTYAGDGAGADGYTGFDNVASGKLVGDAAVRWIESTKAAGRATAAVTTLSALPDVAGRWEEPEKLIKGAGVDVVSTQDCADQACGLQITEALLRAHPDLRIFVGLNDDAALGAVRAFTNAGVPADQVFVAGQDGGLEALTAIRDGGYLKVSAAIDMDGLATAIVTNSRNAVDGAGQTRSDAAVIEASTADRARLDQLVAQQS